MDVIYSENVFGKYIDSLDGVSGLDFSNTETRKNYTDNFWSSVYGIDSRYIEELNKTLDKPIDLTAFEKGELVVLSAMTDDEGNLLIQPGQAITVVGESGEQVFTCLLYTSRPAETKNNIKPKNKDAKVRKALLGFLKILSSAIRDNFVL